MNRGGNGGQMHHIKVITRTKVGVNYMMMICMSQVNGVSGRVCVK